MMWPPLIFMRRDLEPDGVTYRFYGGGERWRQLTPVKVLPSDFPADAVPEMVSGRSLMRKKAMDCFWAGDTLETQSYSPTAHTFIHPGDRVSGDIWDSDRIFLWGDYARTLAWLVMHLAFVVPGEGEGTNVCQLRRGVFRLSQVDKWILFAGHCPQPGAPLRETEIVFTARQMTAVEQLANLGGLAKP